MAREVPFGPTDTANSVLRHANDKLGIRVVIDHNAPINRFFTCFRHTGANYENSAHTAGYADGTGGTIRLRICPMSAGGTPNLAATVATETVAAQTLWNRRTDYSGTTATSQGSYFLPRTPSGAIWTHPAGEAWWYVIDNVDADPASNWISFNGVDMRPSPGGDTQAQVGYLGPNGVNYPFTPRPAGSFAVAGLDPRECVAWTTTGDNGSWAFGNVGGLEGQTRPPRPGQGASTGYYASPKLATYGWTETAGAVLAKVGQPFGYNGGGATATGALRVDNCKRAVTVTHVGCLHDATPGTITFLNRTTGLSSTCSSFTSHNGGAVRRGALATPVVVNVGDNIELSATSMQYGFDPDSSSNTMWDYATNTRTWRWYRAGSTTIDFAAMLFADPWPDYEAAAATDTTPPTVTVDLTNGTVITTTQLVTASPVDAGGISKVEFYVDGQLVATDTTAPYQYTIDVSSGLWTNEVQTISGSPSASFGITFEGQAGGETLSTTATAASIDAYLEALSNVGSGGVSCTGGPLPAAVNVTFNGTAVAGRNLSEMTIAGTATGVNFATTTDGAGYGPPGSTHTLTARAYDTAGNSAEVSRTFQAGVVGVDNTPPVLTVNLGNGQVLTGATNTITATATDANGIREVDFYIDDVLVATDTSAPYTCNIDATAYTPGSTHTLKTYTMDLSSRLTTNQQGVETDTTGFVGNGPAAAPDSTIARTTAQAHTGSASLRVTATAAATATQAGTLRGTSGFPIVHGGIYYMEVWVRTPRAGETYTLNFEKFDATGAGLGASGTSFAATQNVWTRLYRSDTVTATGAVFGAVSVRVDNLGIGDTFDLDDFWFSPGGFISRTFQAAGTPPSPLPDPCATVEAALITRTAERDSAVAARDAAITARDLAITERDNALASLTAANTALANCTQTTTATPPTELLYYRILTDDGADRYHQPVSTVVPLTLHYNERRAVVAAGWIELVSQ